MNNSKINWEKIRIQQKNKPSTLGFYSEKKGQQAILRKAHNFEKNSNQDQETEKYNSCPQENFELRLHQVEILKSKPQINSIVLTNFSTNDKSSNTFHDLNNRKPLHLGLSLDIESDFSKKNYKKTSLNLNSNHLKDDLNLKPNASKLSPLQRKKMASKVGENQNKFGQNNFKMSNLTAHQNILFNRIIKNKAVITSTPVNQVIRKWESKKTVSEIEQNLKLNIFQSSIFKKAHQKNVDNFNIYNRFQFAKQPDSLKQKTKSMEKKTFSREFQTKIANILFKACKPRDKLYESRTSSATSFFQSMNNGSKIKSLIYKKKILKLMNDHKIKVIRPKSLDNVNKSVTLLEKKIKKGNLFDMGIFRRRKNSMECKFEKLCEGKPQNNRQILWGFRSRRGYNHNDLHKKNQDSCFVHPNFAGEEIFHLFGVCDGHGKNGEKVSEFVSKQFPLNLKQSFLEIKKIKQTEFINFISENMEILMYKALKKTVQDLLGCDFDCQFSGCTFAASLFVENKVCVCNVGDSRTIMAFGDSFQNVIELSIDHKPENISEKKRIESKNGKVARMLDESGIPCGPLRVWKKDENLPGLAMSRAIGDEFAKSIGVSWKPDTVVKNLPSELGVIVVLGTDGVFEVMSNKSIIDAASRYFEIKDIEAACDLIITKAVGQWEEKNYDIIDDITYIVIYY